MHLDLEWPSESLTIIWSLWSLKTKGIFIITLSLMFWVLSLNSMSETQMKWLFVTPSNNFCRDGTVLLNFLLGLFCCIPRSAQSQLMPETCCRFVILILINMSHDLHVPHSVRYSMEYKTWMTCFFWREVRNGVENLIVLFYKALPQCISV